MPAPKKTELRLPEMRDAPIHEVCWAKTTKDRKPGISVRDHCLTVGCVAEALLDLLPRQLRELIPTGAATLAALHDIGKVSPGFQVKSESWVVQHALRDRAVEEGWAVQLSDHARISQFTVQELLGNSQLHRWAAAVGAHHGRVKGERVQTREPWEEERRRLAAELIKEFGPLPKQPPGDSAIWFVAGLITIADWIGSDERHFPQNAVWDTPERRTRARMALTTINWRSIEARKLSGFGDLFPETPQANGLQAATMQAVREPGIYVIEGPMGYGKTEAALAATYRLFASGKATGLYFALPTQVTSNRIHLRVQPFVDRICANAAAVRLAHSGSWLFEAEAPAQLSPAIPDDEEARDHVHAGRSWFASAKRALLAPFGVGTIDQALLGIVAAKHFFVREFGLAGKVVILDEVHTYDLYTSTLIDALVKRLRELQCTVIILSATLTENRRRELLRLADDQPVSAAYPLVSGVASSLIERACNPPPSKTIQIRCLSGALPLEEAIDRASHGECLLWIRNTVEDAQETYRALQSINLQGGPSIALLHSRFPFFRREQLEDYWMNRLGKDSIDRPAGCILVSTQVAEQSVDIDADLLITDLAPTDMLLQRIGRLWRHDRTGRPCPEPEVWIHMPHLDGASLRDASEKELLAALGRSARVYAPYILLRSLYQWRCKATIILPDDIRPILEATYADPRSDEPRAWQGLRKQLESQKEKLARQALSATAIWSYPPLPDEEGVQTRYSTDPMAQLLMATEITFLDSHSVRLCLLDGTAVTAHDCNWSFEAAKAIYRNLARVPHWPLAIGLPESPRWLANQVAQPTVLGVVRPDGSICWPADEHQTGLSYHADQGIIIRRERVRAPYEESYESYD
jgi:CRISPR-associated endonuclease/helicase Cas3